jgi:hypothetical protein
MNYQLNIPQFCTKCLKKNNLTNFTIQIENENQQQEKQFKDQRENQIGQYVPHAKQK